MQNQSPNNSKLFFNLDTSFFVLEDHGNDKFGFYLFKEKQNYLLCNIDLHDSLSSIKDTLTSALIENGLPSDENSVLIVIKNLIYL